MPDTPEVLNDRITAYLSGGGLFNPELANHEAVRDLLIDCRAAIHQGSSAPKALKTERDAFEADRVRHVTEYSKGRHLPHFDRTGDGYQNPLVHAAWQGWKARAALSAEPPAGQQDEAVTVKQQKLRELADRIDHEKLWAHAALEHRDWPQDKRDRMNAGVALRRYSDLWKPGHWVIFPPVGPVHFSAGTLDKAVEMAKKDETRKTLGAQDHE